ncbi:MAG: radical SAM protein [Erysipelotrichaceae bacterium]|nr:radical SAM protein [Erysipelotrichaceae bacterium]
MKAKYVEAPLTEYLHRKASVLHNPLSGTFELTPLCNMNCRMCYVRMSKKDQEAIRPLRKAEEWIELGKIAKEKGMLYLLLTGGEPFFYPNFRYVMESLHQLGLLISINTNATLINEETVAWLKDVPPVRMNITLYGASDETYERLCRNPHGFTQVTHAIHLLKEAGIPIKINCSVTPFNKDDLEAIFDFCEKEELIVQATSYMFPPLRRDETMIGQNERFTSDEAAYYSALIEYLSNGKERFLEHYEDNEYNGLLADQDSDCQVIEGEGMHCRAGKCSFWVTWEGKLLACGMMPVDKPPNVFETGFDEAWQQAIDTASQIRLPVECANCSQKKQCHACAAMVYTESGNYHTVPKYRCELAKAYPKYVKEFVDKLKGDG